MASSVSESQNITNGVEGVVSTAFSTPKGDSILIVNPTATSYSQLAIAINNPHNTNATTANVYTMNNPSAPAAAVSSTVTLTSTSTGFTAKVSVPALSVVGITLPAHSSKLLLRSGGVNLRRTPVPASPEDKWLASALPISANQL